MWRFVFIALLVAAPLKAEIISAKFSGPTERYDHGILGDAIEYGTLELTFDDGQGRKFILPQSRVFEDLAPRLTDVDGDGDMEVIVVETSLTLGAQMAIYDENGKLAATPFLGRPQRWLAPIGARDLDGDGRIEIAFIEKPHLRKILRVWRLEGRKLVLIDSLGGLTNHQIGQNFISGGIRDCGQGPEIVTANADWTRVMASTLKDDKLSTRDIGAFTGASSLKSALACKS